MSSEEKKKEEPSSSSDGAKTTNKTPRSTTEKPRNKKEKATKESSNSPKKSNKPVKPEKVDPTNKSQNIDKTQLDEFLILMDDWQKVATGQEPSSTVPEKRDVRSFTNACRESLVNFATTNSLIGQTSSSRILEVAHSTAKVISEQRIKAQELLNQHNSAFRMCGSISQMIWNVLEVFTQFYHALASDHPFPAINQDFITQSLKTSFESLECTFGWSLDKELEVYESLPFKGDFPPIKYRSENFDDKMEKYYREYSKNLNVNERLFTLPSLLKRFQEEYAFRMTSICIPNIDASILNKVKSGKSGDGLKDALSAHIISEYRKIFSFDTNAGNYFTASRAALYFLMHAQVVLDVLCNTPMFGPLVDSSNDTRITLDLLKNIPRASSYFNMNEISSVNEIEVIRKKISDMTFDSNKTIGDMHKEIEQKKFPKTHPRNDLVHTLITMFFDAPLSACKNDLERQLKEIQLSQSAFYIESLHFSPFFVHQDSSFLQEYFSQNPTSDYSQIFHPDDKRDKRDKREKLLIFRKSGDHPLKIANAIHQLNTTESRDKAQVFTSISRLSTSPDIVGSTQSCSDLSNFEEKSLNYINKRSISATTFEMLRITLRTINSYAHAFYQNQETVNHHNELLHRYISLLLGYNRAYNDNERPSDITCLNLDYIIPFLYRNCQAICDPAKAKDTRVLGLEFEYTKSPLVQIIFRYASLHPKIAPPVKPQLVKIPKPVLTETTHNTESTMDVAFDASAIIHKLYKLWESSKKDVHANMELNNYLIELITLSRYENFPVKEALETNVEKAKTEVTYWMSVEKQVDSFMNFLRKYEVALSHSTPLPENLCPSMDHVSVLEEDAQLPREVL